MNKNIYFPPKYGVNRAQKKSQKKFTETDIFLDRVCMKAKHLNQKLVKDFQVGVFFNKGQKH